MRWLDGIPGSMDMSLSKLWSWWWTGKPGMLQSMGSQRVRHDWATQLNWTESLTISELHSLPLPFQEPTQLFPLPVQNGGPNTDGYWSYSVCICILCRYVFFACVCAKLLQLCPALCDPMDCSPPGSSVHGVLPGKNTGVRCYRPPGDLSNLGIEPVSLVSCIGRQVLYY